MSVFLQNLLTASLYGSVIIMVILPLRLLLRNAPKNIVCLLWLLAAVRLLVPFQLESTWSLQPDFVQDVPTRLEQTFTPPIDDPVIPESTPGSTEPVPIPSSPTVTAPADPPVTQRRTADPMVIAGWIWVAGAVGLAVYGAGSYLLLRRRATDAVILSEGVWITRLNTAMVLGFFRPKVYLCAGLDETQQEFVLRHEKCHIRRGDHWWKPLGFLALAIHWFNPLVHLGYWLLCRDLEMACDEAVIRNLDLSQRKSYSAALLSCSAHRHTIAACPVAFGEVSVKERIKNVLNYKKPAFWIVLVAVIAIVVVAVCFLTSPGKPEEEPASAYWGIEAFPQFPTASSVTMLLTQAGVTPEEGYCYDESYTLEVWDGSPWKAVEPITTPTFSEEVLWVNLGGKTSIFIDWSPYYGELPSGIYRICKTFRDPATGATRTFQIQFELNLNTITIPDHALSANDEKTLQMLELAMEKLRQQESYYFVSEMTLDGYPPQTGSTTVFAGNGDRWMYHQQVHMRVTSENWSSGNMLLDGTQYRYGHAQHYTADRNWTVATKNQQTNPHWLLRSHILQENITLVMTSYTADTIVITLYFDGAPRDSWEGTCYGYVQTWHLDLSWNLLGVTEGCTMLHSTDGVDYYVRTTTEIQILDTDPAEITAWLDAVEAEIRADNP